MIVCGILSLFLPCVCVGGLTKQPEETQGKARPWPQCPLHGPKVTLLCVSTTRRPSAQALAQDELSPPGGGGGSGGRVP